MIDYFVRPLEGITLDLSRRRLDAWRQRTGMTYRAKPAALDHGPLDAGRGDGPCIVT